MPSPPKTTTASGFSPAATSVNPREAASAERRWLTVFEPGLSRFTWKVIRITSHAAATAERAVAQETFVLAHEEVRFHDAQRIQRHAHDDEQGRTAEEA